MLLTKLAKPVLKVLPVVLLPQLHIAHKLKGSVAKRNGFFGVAAKKARGGGYRQHPNNQYGYNKFY
jgi:hypothetical protein